MTWGRRIRLYLVGFGLGLIIVWIMFYKNGNRDLSSWFPSNRVLRFISFSKKINADSILLCRLKCEGISLDDIRKASTSGNVHFDKSETHKEPAHEYDVTMTVKGKALEIYLAENTDDSTSTIIHVYPESIGAKCDCK